MEEHPGSSKYSVYNTLGSMSLRRGQSIEAEDVLWKPPRSASVAQWLAQMQAKVRDRLGDVRYAAAHEAGAALTLEEAIALETNEA